MTTEQALEKIKTAEQIYAAFSQVTRLPFVTCDPESFNDQIWVFSTEKEIQEFAKKYTEEKVLLAAYCIPKEHAMGFYHSLHALGINTVVYNEAEERTEVELTAIIPAPDLSDYPEGQAPLFNPSLQLSGIYFMQEMRRPVPEEEKKNLKELQEELNANLVRSEFLMAVEPIDEERIRIPYVKNEKGEIYQPVFSDAFEYQKFAKGRKFRVLKLPFAKLGQRLLESSKGFAINPNGFNLLLQKQQAPAAEDAKKQ